MNIKNFLLRASRKRWVRFLAGALVLYAGLGFLVLPAVIRSQVPKRLSKTLHRPVALARVRVNPFALSVTLDGFNVQDRDGAPLLGWDRLYVNLSSLSLVRLAPVFQEIRLEGCHGRVVLDAKGNPNFQDLLEPEQPAAPAKPSGPPPDLRIQRLEVVGARLEFVDHATAPPFATTLGPVSLTLDGFRLSRDSQTPYAFTARTERGETFAWRGRFALDPLRSQGAFQVGKLYLPKYRPFYDDQVAFGFLGGTLDCKASYDFQWGEGVHRFRLEDGEAGLDGLAVAESGRPGAVLALAKARLQGLRADLFERWARAEALSLEGARLEARRDADGSFNLVRMARTRTPAAEPPQQPFRFDLGELRLADAAVRYQDLTPRRPVDLTLDQLQASVKGFSLEPEGRCQVSLDLRWNGKGKAHAAGTVAPMRAAGTLDLQLDALDLRPCNGYLEPVADVLVAAGTVGLKGRLDFDAPKDRYGFQGDARCDGLKAQDGPGREALVGWDSLRLTGIKTTTVPPSFSLAALDWDAPAARYVLNPKGGSNLAAVAAPAPAQPAAAGPAWRAELGGVHIRRGSFTFVDRTIQPVAALSLDAVEAQVGRLSTDPGVRASLDLKARVDGAAPLAAKGTVNLLSQAAFTDVKVTMGGMDLSPLSPYSGHYVGYGIEKGKLELDLAYLVQDRKLAGENKLRLDQFTLGDKVDSPEAMHVPIKLGLALLRDRNGMIDLDVPVRGDLDSPDFKLGKVIWRAIVNVFVKIATSPFSLIGNLFGGGASDLSLVAFAPGADGLDAQALQVLATLEKGLYERPGLRLEMEGTADEGQDLPALRRAALDATLARLKGAPVTPEDRERWLRAAYLEAFPPPKDVKASKDKGKDKPAEPALAEQEARLLAKVELDPAALKLLARRRVQAARDRILQGGKVEEARVFITDGGDRARKEGGSRVYFELK